MAPDETIEPRMLVRVLTTYVSTKSAPELMVATGVLYTIKKVFSSRTSEPDTLAGHSLACLVIGG